MVLFTIYQPLIIKEKGLLEESKKWHYKGIDISQKYNEKNIYYTHKHGLANLFAQTGNNESALKAFKECLNYKEDKEITYGSYINIGNIYASQGDYDTSNDYFNKALNILNENENPHAIAIIKLNLAINSQEQKDFDKAITLYNEVVEITDANEFHQLALITRLNIASIFIDLKKYNDAEIAYAAGLGNAVELGYLNEQKVIYDNLKDLSIKKNDYKAALNFVLKSNTINDSINKLQKDKEIQEMEVKYKTLQKEKKITVLQVENHNRSLELENKNEALDNLKLRQEVETKENENRILSFENASEKKLVEIILLKKDQEIQEAKLIKEKSNKFIILYSFLILLIPVIGLLYIYYQKLQTQSELNKKQEEINKKEISSLIVDQELKLIKAAVKGKDKERKRISQELHDSIGGNLAAIKLKLNNSINDDNVDFL